MGRIWAIALNTFREAVRDRVLYGVVGFGAALQLFALALAELALDQQARVVRDVGLATVSLFSVVIAVFLGSSLLYKEIERKTLYVILPKPIRRDEFLLGKYAGIVLTAAVFVGVAGGLQLAVQAVEADAPGWALAAAPLALGAGLTLAMWRARDPMLTLPPFALLALASGAGVAALAGLDPLPTLWALALVLGEVVLLTAVAVFFSSFSTPFLTGAFTAGVWILGRSAGEMATIRSSVLPGAVRELLHGLAWVVPNFHLFVPSHRLLEGVVEGQAPAVSYVATSLGYGVAYAAVLLVASAAVFRRRDFL
jgi:ABC-type transport system involved in multi-copper enzyme maturation permease subunit